LRQQVEQQAQEKHELQFKIDTSNGDSATVQRDYQLIQDQNLRLLDENNGMRGRVNDLSNQNRDLDLKVSQLMAQRSNPPVYEERNPGLDRSVVSQSNVGRSFENKRNDSSSYSPLRPNRAISGAQDLSQ
jgi:hypothetical protein